MSAGSVEVSEEDKRRHREAEKSLKEVRVQSHSFFSCIYSSILSQHHVLTTLYHQAKQKLASQVKVRRDDSQGLIDSPNRAARYYYWDRGIPESPRF